ncbi:MAG: TetR/AcrR family transcriptional regulator [Actinomycetota bacterium]|nr:MAG: TetR/AcrR family transcriptional regulator [Actinomycetota bacterium]
MAVRGEARQTLLAAARTMFAERGYDRTTTRDIAASAGVDATLITRYFGSKAKLYLAALQLDLASGPPPDLLYPGRIATTLDRVGTAGPGPLLRAATHPQSDETIARIAREVLTARMVEPLAQRFERDGLDQPRLRAEIAVAAFAGITLGRTSGMFPELADMPNAALSEVIEIVLSSVASPWVAPEPTEDAGEPVTAPR